jgi:hypothetical protein
MCARLTEAANVAEKKAEDAVAELAKAEELNEVRKSRIKEMKRAAVVVLRTIHGAPPRVAPHLHPSMRPPASPPDRFDLVELE